LLLCMSSFWHEFSFLELTPKFKVSISQYNLFTVLVLPSTVLWSRPGQQVATPFTMAFDLIAITVLSSFHNLILLIHLNSQFYDSALVEFALKKDYCIH
jgi:hypothetical protein